ncbi:hypothetical protein AMTR_s00158p00073670 [Amborella trichopoda]|uniref:Uncharacterized protein n=1 Tax=Amborella trichopoda TaxID=13333 RepID=W1PSX6_AMBTC|nr:hypothetical protein AMTR_s00158p00073670 [Amborella trichopoda]
MMGGHSSTPGVPVCHAEADGRRKREDSCDAPEPRHKKRAHARGQGQWLAEEAILSAQDNGVSTPHGLHGVATHDC